MKAACDLGHLTKQEPRSGGKNTESGAHNNNGTYHCANGLDHVVHVDGDCAGPVEARLAGRLRDCPGTRRDGCRRRRVDFRPPVVVRVGVEMAMSEHDKGIEAYGAPHSRSV